MEDKLCCSMGTYNHTVSMPINGRLQSIDVCISDIVAALNAANIKTLGSCCGHGKILPSVILEDDVYIILADRETAHKIIEENKI